MNAQAWIIHHSNPDAESVDGGAFPTDEGKLSVIDPLCTTDANYINVPSSGGRLFVMDEDGDWARMAILFGDGDVAGGKHHFDCFVDGGAASFVTPLSLKALNELRNDIPQVYPKDNPNHGWPAPNLYIEHFEQFDEENAEPLAAKLPDGTLVPFVRSGFGDGVYPVFSLHDESGSVLGVYCDFLGNEETENWIMPPGMTLS